MGGKLEFPAFVTFSWQTSDVFWLRNNIF